MRIDICGTRGSTSAPGREFVRYGGHTSCLAITPDGAEVPELLLDAGLRGIREVTRLLAGRPFLGTIALTLLHWDHVQGLTLLAREIPHKGGRTFGYRVSAGGHAIAYLPDHDPSDLGPGPEGFGPCHEAALDLARDADILLHDSFWVAEDFDPARTFGHAAAEYATGLAGGPVPTTLAADGDVIYL